MYQTVTDPRSGEAGAIKRLEDGAFIPLDPANREYAAYLAWVDAGNAPETDAPSFADLKTQKLADLSARRAQAEFAFTFGGAPINLITETQSRIANAVQGMQLAVAAGEPNPTVEWQVVPGVFVSFDLPTVQALGLAAYNHVQACFANAKTLAAATLAAADAPALDAVDLDAGWPA